MNKKLSAKINLIAFFALFFTLILTCIIVFTLPSEDGSKAEVNTLTVASQDASQNGKYNHSIQINTPLAVAAGAETGTVIGVLAGIMGAVACGVAVVAIKSAKQSKDIAKNKNKNKFEDYIESTDKESTSVIESDNFDDDLTDAVTKEEYVVEEVKEELVEEPLADVVNDNFEEEPAEADDDIVAEVIEEDNTDEVSNVEEASAIISEELTEESSDVEENEDDEEVFTFMQGDKVVRVRFLRSFTAKVIQGEELLQNSYNDLKNYVMGYKGTKDRISFSYDSINKGRQQLIKFAIRGKHLCVFCALDQTEVSETWHTEVTTYKRYLNVPVFVRVKGSVTLERARKMIDLVCKKYDLTFTEKQNVDYKMPYEPNEPLIERNLIKVYSDGDIDGATLIAANFRDKLSLSENKINESEVVEELIEKEPENKEPEEIILDDDGEEKEEIVINDGDKVVRIRMVRSFTAKLIQGSELVQNSYNALKNHALGFENATARISFPYDSINKVRQQLIKFVIRGKDLYVYCAIKPDEITESWRAGITKYKRYQNVPVYIKIKGNTTLEIAKRMINYACKSFELKFTKEQTVNYKLPYENNAALIDRKLIKIYSDSELDSTLLIKAKYGNSLNTVSAVEVSSMMSDIDALEIVNKSVVDTKIKESTETEYVAPVKSVKKGIVNIDILSKHFENGDLIDIKALADKKLIEQNVTVLKVLARGILNKRFTVKANDFSLDAVKMITLMGGKIIIVK